ncbi:phospholipase [Halobacteriales archaeon QS_8_69_26]|nr:MAG: phospholipase [Halobacteriales archaeon QS_8_69_26]
MDESAGSGGDGPHGDGRVYRWGADPEGADAAVVLLHGRGASAEAMVDLVDQIRRPGAAYLAPQATDYTWYPYSFMASIEDNQPHLSSALSWVDDLFGELSAAGVDADRVLLMGFSQGGCLASEYAVRNARRYGGLAALSGGLIGPEGAEWHYDGDFEGTPALLGCSDHDPHIPVERVHRTEEVLAAMGAEVDKRIYRDMGHLVNADEIEAVDGILGGMLA